MVYARTVGKKTLTLRVSGLLWNRSLIMNDLETGSEWSQLLGKAMKGKLEGAKLRSIPAQLTTWDDWKKQHPKTTVLNLPRTSNSYGVEFYRDRSQFVLGLVIGETAKAWPFDALGRERAVQDTLAGVPLLVTFDRRSTRALVFSRMLGKEKLHFQWDPDTGELQDRKSKTTWDPTSGRAVKGPRKGAQLEILPGIVSHRRAWRAFHPLSAIMR